jgi:segregation and condensation protein A
MDKEVNADSEGAANVEVVADSQKGSNMVQASPETNDSQSGSGTPDTVEDAGEVGESSTSADTDGTKDDASVPVDPRKKLQDSISEKFDPDKDHHENIYGILTDQEEITWKSIIVELIKTEKMDPWDVNVSLLSKTYIKTLKKLKEQNLALSGKVLLCAALLLRIKSTKLVGEDLMEFDRLLASGENDDMYDSDYVEGELDQMGVKINVDGKDLQLLPKTPQPRKRKVSVYDLIDALAVALNVRRRRILNKIKVTQHDAPEKKFDLSQLMDDMYLDVVGYLDHYGTDKVAFSDLCPGDNPHDKVLTFIPLLHMTNSRKTDLDQPKHFGEIWIKPAKEGAAAMKDKNVPKEPASEGKKGSEKVAEGV